MLWLFDKLCLHGPSIVIGLISICVMYYRHVNSLSKASWEYAMDYAFERVCHGSDHMIACAVGFGAFENFVLFGALFAFYRLVCHFFWRWRYESDITNIIDEIAKQEAAKKRSDYVVQDIEETTKKMGYSYNLDPFVLFCPYLISPIMKWDSMTNLLVHLSYFITFYNVSSLNQDSAATATEESTPWKIKFSEIEIIQLHWPKIINPFPESFKYEDDIVLHYSIFRSVWTFVIWTIIDYILWRGDYGLVYLFETGINNIMHRYTKLHCGMINNLLLSHVEHIQDLSNLIVSFHGDGPLEHFLLIKVKIHECLRDFQLELLFNIVTAFTVLSSSMRLYYVPVVVNLMNPICYILGITAFIVFVAILVFNGIGSDAIPRMRLATEFDKLFDYFTQIGAVLLSVLWAFIVWRNMKTKKEELMAQQKRSLYKEFMKKVFDFQYHNFLFKR